MQDLLMLCDGLESHITAYSPLGNNNVGAKKLFEYPEVIAIANKYGHPFPSFLL